MEILSWHSPGETEENHKKPLVRIAASGQDLNLGPPEYGAEVLAA
jgi:hypothetical protein